MSGFEYRVVPAPRRGEKARGVKTTEERFALALTQLMNKLGREGWEYQRSDTLPVEERVGLTGSKTTYQNMLVFRRSLAEQECESVATMDRPAEWAPRLGTGTPVPEALTASLAPAVPALGAATKPEGAAPALGPAKADLAAE
ncbi:DUF4177 domain-containing protein [Stagnihabitans tardus]|uniref:DUF4177 domain-containing protein n=1 Tax=Stagnihabitans tardus TaxID=2699202 RepID=A0AAE5BT60_9RHOB|nr:DUF4177 domain-containing protein [Stagnihabitans tardus]NBZ86271.1 DUF4177 domain-containing protein [Stagnihabitans tardus]